MSVQVLRNKKPYSYQKVAINYTASKDTGTFVLSPTIKAELAEYDVKVYAIHNDQDSVLMVTRENLVAGDAYIIYGQSNARGWEELDPYTNEFCRTYGFGYDTNQFKWGLSNSDYTGYSFDRQIVGQWGINFQKYIMNTYGIPTCVISHASPGQPIRNLVERNPTNHADISTQYGRLLTYVTQAKLNNAVKGLFIGKEKQKLRIFLANGNHYLTNFIKNLLKITHRYNNIIFFNFLYLGSFIQ
jgi:hypothetical protein